MLFRGCFFHNPTPGGYFLPNLCAQPRQKPVKVRISAPKEEDIALEEELLSDEKERAEHVMLVDLARNDCGKISELGSVRVSKFMNVQRYSHVMHIVSLVEGRRNGEYHPLDLVSSFLPAGTLSGAPKIRAMEIIDELETVRRGLYGGATGYLDFGGNMPCGESCPFSAHRFHLHHTPCRY